MLDFCGKFMLVEACCENGVFVHVSKMRKCCDVVESFCVGELLFVVFESGHCVVECLDLPDGKCVVFDGLKISLAKFA